MSVSDVGKHLSIVVAYCLLCSNYNNRFVKSTVTGDLFTFFKIMLQNNIDGIFFTNL
jgi:hypothetical protein